MATILPGREDLACHGHGADMHMAALRLRMDHFRLVLKNCSNLSKGILPDCLS